MFYHQFFATFYDFEFALPEILVSFDLNLSLGAFAYVAALADSLMHAPSFFLHALEALSALNFALTISKMVTVFLNWIVAKIKEMILEGGGENVGVKFMFYCTELSGQDRQDAVVNLMLAEENFHKRLGIQAIHTEAADGGVVAACWSVGADRA